MPDREELEELISIRLDDKEIEKVREAIRKLDAERLDEIFSKGGGNR